LNDYFKNRYGQVVTRSGKIDFRRTR